MLLENHGSRRAYKTWIRYGGNDMDLVQIFLVSELIILWVTAIIAVWQFKWDRDDRKESIGSEKVE